LYVCLGMTPIGLLFPCSPFTLSHSLIIWIISQKVLSICFQLVFIQVPVNFSLLLYSVIMSMCVFFSALTCLLFVSLSINTVSFKVSFVVGLPVSSALNSTAWFASTGKPTLSITRMKVFKSGGEKIEAAVTLLLRYNIIHNGSHFLLSRPGMFQHRQDTTLLPLHYSTNPPVAQAHAVSIPSLWEVNG
jgi:alpha-D-ribose 1-methylphosphonate 5-triphosphate synthase subunit PhnH